MKTLPSVSIEHQIPGPEYLLPDFTFKLQDIPQVDTPLIEWLTAFIKENAELVPTAPLVNLDQYARGFRDALALVNLWITTDLGGVNIEGDSTVSVSNPYSE